MLNQSAKQNFTSEYKRARANIYNRDFKNTDWIEFVG